MSERYVDEREVAKITGRAVQTLRNDRYRGQGIKYVKIGRSVRYSLNEVTLFMEQHTINTGNALESR